MLILWQPRLKGAKSWKFKVGTHQGLKNNGSILIYVCELLEEIITVHTAFLAFLSNITVRVCVCEWVKAWDQSVWNIFACSGVQVLKVKVNAIKLIQPDVCDHWVNEYLTVASLGHRGGEPGEGMILSGTQMPSTVPFPSFTHMDLI